jgi:Ca2+/Na+ antiporter
MSAAAGPQLAMTLRKKARPVGAWGLHDGLICSSVYMQAVSACFSGPLFNLLAGMSVSLIYQNMSSGDVFVVLDNPALIIILATALCMLLMAVVIPQEKYVMGRHWITLLAVFYVAFNIAYVLNQMGWLWSNPWLAAPSKA